MAKVSVNVRPVAGKYDTANEKTIEYSGPDGTGGLICFRVGDDGRVSVDLYRHDEGVEIRVGKAG